LLLATTAKLFGLEGALRLELGAPMFGDVPFGHGCDGFVDDDDECCLRMKRRKGEGGARGNQEAALLKPWV
jgi:hypothetical protein